MSSEPILLHIDTNGKLWIPSLLFAYRAYPYSHWMYFQLPIDIPSKEIVNFLVISLNSLLFLLFVIFRHNKFWCQWLIDLSVSVRPEWWSEDQQISIDLFPFPAWNSIALLETETDFHFRLISCVQRIKARFVHDMNFIFHHTYDDSDSNCTVFGYT